MPCPDSGSEVSGAGAIFVRILNKADSKFQKFCPDSVIIPPKGLSRVLPHHIPCDRRDGTGLLLFLSLFCRATATTPTASPLCAAHMNDPRPLPHPLGHTTESFSSDNPPASAITLDHSGCVSTHTSSPAADSAQHRALPAGMHTSAPLEVRSPLVLLRQSIPVGRTRKRRRLWKPGKNWQNWSPISKCVPFYAAC